MIPRNVTLGAGVGTRGEELFGAFPQRGNRPCLRHSAYGERNHVSARDVRGISKRGRKRRFVTVSHLAVVFSLLIWMLSGGASADELPSTGPPGNEATVPSSNGPAEAATDLPGASTSESTEAPSAPDTEGAGDPSTVTTQAGSPQTTESQAAEATETTTDPGAETTEADHAQSSETTESQAAEATETTEPQPAEATETTGPEAAETTETTEPEAAEATEATTDPGAEATEVDDGQSSETTEPEGAETTGGHKPSGGETEASSETTQVSSTESPETIDAPTETAEVPGNGTVESQSPGATTDPHGHVSGADVPAPEAATGKSTEPNSTDTTESLAETVTPDATTSGATGHTDTSLTLAETVTTGPTTEATTTSGATSGHTDTSATPTELVIPEPTIVLDTTVTDSTVTPSETVSSDPTTVIDTTVTVAESVIPEPTTVTDTTVTVAESVIPEPTTVTVTDTDTDTDTDSVATPAEIVSPEPLGAAAAPDAVASLVNPLESAVTDAITDALIPFTEAVTHALTPFTVAMEPITHAVADAVTLIIDAMQAAAYSPPTSLDVAALIDLLKSTVPPELSRIAEQMAKDALAAGTEAMRAIVTSTGVPSQAIQGVGLALAAHYAAVLNSGGPGTNRFKDPAKGRRGSPPGTSGRFLHCQSPTFAGCESASDAPLEELLFAFPLPLRTTVPSPSRLLKPFSDRVPGPLFFSSLEQPG